MVLWLVAGPAAWRADPRAKARKGAPIERTSVSSKCARDGRYRLTEDVVVEALARCVECVEDMPAKHRLLLPMRSSSTGTRRPFTSCCLSISSKPGRTPWWDRGNSSSTVARRDSTASRAACSGSCRIAGTGPFMSGKGSLPMRRGYDGVRDTLALAARLAARSADLIPVHRQCLVVVGNGGPRHPPTTERRAVQFGWSIGRRWGLVQLEPPGAPLPFDAGTGTTSCS